MRIENISLFCDDISIFFASDLIDYQIKKQK